MKFEMIRKMREFLVWSAALVFWGFGALILSRIWNYQKSLPDPLGSYIEFTVMFLATFYALAFFPVRHLTDRFFSVTWRSVLNDQGL